MNEETMGKNELIGLHVTIKECKDPDFQGKHGVVINETKNTFLIAVSYTHLTLPTN